MSEKHLTAIEKLAIYLKYRNTPINTHAIFSDESPNFLSPDQPSTEDAVTISLRTAVGNIDNAYIVCNNARSSMSYEKTVGMFDYYTHVIPCITSNISYYFELAKNNDRVYYNKRGVSQDIDQLYNFKVIVDFKIPQWAKGAVMYQIFVDRFRNGDPANDVVSNEYVYLGKPVRRVDDWDAPVLPDDVGTFYGGDLKGVMEKMSYLKELGVDVIYLNPLFVSPSNHKYDIQDYDYVDPHFGVIVKDNYSPLTAEKFHNKFADKYIERSTDKENLEASNKLLVDLIELAHDNGIKVLLDGVFNHCGAFNKWLDREGLYFGHGSSYSAGAYRSKDSPYNKYFRWFDHENWPGNDAYDSWWGFYNHPKLNFQDSDELYAYIMETAKKWVSPPFNADGWRLDVAADVGYSKEFNHQFWRDFRRAVKDANPDAIILAEHYGDALDWVMGDQWDTIMNYDAFMEPITWFLTGMEKHSEQFRQDQMNNSGALESAMRYHLSRMTPQAAGIAMNELSNHDHSRFLTRTNKTIGRLHTRGGDAACMGVNYGIMREAVVFQMTWQGNPTIYYGDEVGLAGWTDPDNRRPFPWDSIDDVILDFHKKMIAVHKAHSSILNGSTEYLLLEYGVLCYGRFNADDKIVVALNNNSEAKELCIPVWRIEVGMGALMRRLILSDANNFNIDETTVSTVNGYLKITLPAFGAAVFNEV